MDSRLVARRFGTNLRSARRIADYSQEELGLLASLHRTEIGLLDVGRAALASTRFSNSPARWRFPPTSCWRG